MSKNLIKITEPSALFEFVVVLVIVATFLIAALQGKANLDVGAYVFFVTIAVVMFFAIKLIITSIVDKRWLRKQHEKLLLYASENKIPAQFSMPASYLSHSMFSLGNRDLKFDYCYGDESLTYGEFSYAVYRRTRYNEYVAYRFYYAVCIVQLPRELPNIFFDAKATEGRQFKKQFNRSQRHSLEGDFDTYFDTYFPTHYSLDSLSFITPEVMQAMIAAHQYDMEINGDKLYLYAPLRPMPDQLIDMFNKAELVKNTLLNNIVTYRDERVAYDMGRKVVSTVGVRLRRNLTSDYVTLAAGVLILAIFLVVGFAYDKFSFHLFAIGFGLASYSGWTITSERKRWSELDKLNEALTQPHTSGQKYNISR